MEATQIKYSTTMHYTAQYTTIHCTTIHYNALQNTTLHCAIHYIFFFHLTSIYYTPHDTTQYPTTCSSPSLRSPPSNIENLQDPLQSQLRFSSCPPCVAMIQQPLFDMLRCIFAKYVPRLVRHFFFFFFFPRFMEHVLP